MIFDIGTNIAKSSDDDDKAPLGRGTPGICRADTVEFQKSEHPLDAKNAGRVMSILGPWPASRGVRPCRIMRLFVSSGTLPILQSSDNKSFFPTLGLGSAVRARELLPTAKAAERSVSRVLDPLSKPAPHA